MKTIEPIAWERRANGAQLFEPTHRHYRYQDAPRTMCGIAIPKPILKPPVRRTSPMSVDSMSDAEIAAQPPCGRCDASVNGRRPTVFRHLTRLDTAWKPGPGEKYADGPKQLMRVTRMTRAAVYYVPADAPAGTHAKDYMSRETWDRDYAPNLDATLTP